MGEPVGAIDNARFFKLESTNPSKQSLVREQSRRRLAFARGNSGSQIYPQPAEKRGFKISDYFLQLGCFSPVRSEQGLGKYTPSPPGGRKFCGCRVVVVYTFLGPCEGLGGDETYFNFYAFESESRAMQK